MTGTAQRRRTPPASERACLRRAGAGLDFLFVIRTYPEEFDPLLAVGRALERRGYTFGVLTISRTIANACAAQRVACTNLLDLQEPAPALSPPACGAVERRYGLVSLREFCLPESVYLGTSREAPLWERAAAALAAFERYFESTSVGCVVQYLGAEILRRSAYRVALRRGIPHLWLDASPFAGTMDIRVHEGAAFEDAHYDPDRPLDAGQRRELDAAVRAFIEGRRRGGPRFDAPTVTPRKALQFAREVRRTLLVDRREDYYQSVWRITANTARKTLRKHLARPLYQPLPQPPYVFMPLHVPDDSQISVRAPQYLRQEALVDWVARALPQGLTLCVKEHRAGIGAMPPRALADIRRHPNVALVSPDVNALSLVEGAQAVVVIASTIGFKALICRKPVVSLGPSFYRGRGLTHDCDNPADLPAALRRALDTPVDAERVDRLVYAVLRAAWPGAPFAGGDPDQGAESLLAKLDQVRRHCAAP